MSVNYQFTNLDMEKIIVHQIFQRNENRELIEPRYNNEFSKLEEQGLNELQQRIIKAIGNDSYCIEMEIADFTDNSVFQSIAKCLRSSNEEFIRISKDLARKLATVQTSRKIPGGIVVVFRGTIGESSNKYIGIIKAEKHGGFSLTETDTQLLLQYLSNLLLTPQQKLYKIAMFIEKDEPGSVNAARRPDEFKVYVFDHNMNRSETKEAALYFYRDFLGCSIHHSNKKLTKDFYTYTKEYINCIEANDEVKVDLINALHTYLKIDQGNTIQINEFANRFFDNKDTIDEYINYMEDKNVPNHAISKDLTLIKHKLRRRKIKFTSKVTITAPSNEFDNLVKVINSENNKTIVEIEGHIAQQD